MLKPFFIVLGLVLSSLVFSAEENINQDPSQNLLDIEAQALTDGLVYNFMLSGDSLSAPLAKLLFKEIEKCSKFEPYRRNEKSKYFVCPCPKKPSSSVDKPAATVLEKIFPNCNERLPWIFAGSESSLSFRGPSYNRYDLVRMHEIKEYCAGKIKTEPQFKKELQEVLVPPTAPPVKEAEKGGESAKKSKKKELEPNLELCANFFTKYKFYSNTFLKTKNLIHKDACNITLSEDDLEKNKVDLENVSILEKSSLALEPRKYYYGLTASLNNTTRKWNAGDYDQGGLNEASKKPVPSSGKTLYEVDGNILEKLAFNAAVARWLPYTRIQYTPSTYMDVYETVRGYFENVFKEDNKEGQVSSFLPLVSISFSELSDDYSGRAFFLNESTRFAHNIKLPVMRQIDNWDFIKAVFFHEIGHTLGYHHEFYNLDIGGSINSDAGHYLSLLHSFAFNEKGPKDEFRMSAYDPFSIMEYYAWDYQIKFVDLMEAELKNPIGNVRILKENNGYKRYTRNDLSVIDKVCAINDYQTEKFKKAALPAVAFDRPSDGRILKSKDYPVFEKWLEGLENEFEAETQLWGEFKKDLAFVEKLYARLKKQDPYLKCINLQKKADPEITHIPKLLSTIKSDKDLARLDDKFTLPESMVPYYKCFDQIDEKNDFHLYFYNYFLDSSMSKLKLNSKKFKKEAFLKTKSLWLLYGDLISNQKHLHALAYAESPRSGE